MTKSLSFVIPGRLPGMNEIVAAAKSHRMAYASMKKQYTDSIMWLLIKMPKFNGAVDIQIAWHEKDCRRDIDNISGGGQKFILDALVGAGIIKDDSQKYVKSIKHYFEIDKDEPRIEVGITDAE